MQSDIALLGELDCKFLEFLELHIARLAALHHSGGVAMRLTVFLRISVSAVDRMRIRFGARDGLIALLFQ